MSGTVKNENGDEIPFNAELVMSREQYKQASVSIKDGDALIDPLIIDFSGNGASLKNFKIDFGLNNDGTSEKIFVPGEGIGLLAYDKNGNGIIDNGSELFGPLSGNGFSELAQLDSDQNGWIDENDADFSKLKIMEVNGDGSQIVSSLLDKDIGAIYVKSADTAYHLQNQDSVTGVIKETGVWAKESGGVGLLQELDIVV